jgi:hypothetical protein
VTSSLLGPNTLLNTLVSNTLSLRSSLNVSDQVSHPYKTKGNWHNQKPCDIFLHKLIISIHRALSVYTHTQYLTYTHTEEETIREYFESVKDFYTLCYKNFFKNKNISKKTKIKTKEHNNG